MDWRIRVRESQTLTYTKTCLYHYPRCKESETCVLCRVRGERRAVHVLYCMYVAYVPGGGAAPRGMLMQHIVLGLFGTVHGRPPQPTATLYHEGRNVTVLYSTVTVLRCIAESYILV